jgi:ParB family chromosome partitioning protein
VRTVEDHQRLELQLVENLHRKDLNPLEEAQSYRRLMDEFGLTQDQVARRVGKSKSAINQSVRLLDLPAEVQAEVRASEQISKSVLLEIVKQPSPQKQTALWEQARGGELTVKKARQQKPAARAKSRAADRTAKPSAAMAFRYPIQTERALVTITFEQPKVDQEEIVAALEEALSVERARLR